MITYVLTIAKQFPTTHKRAGEQTGFQNAIKEKTKLHTIRGNYKLWAKRFEKINDGKAVLSVREWEDKPYISKQIELFRFTATDGIGIEKLTFSKWEPQQFTSIRKNDGSTFTPILATVEQLAKNDWLAIDDFQDWFKDYDLNEDMAIIHFTGFRYRK